MNKKSVITLVLFMLLTSSLSSTFALAKEIQNESNTAAISLVSSEIKLNTTSKIDEPLTAAVTKEIEITVGYKLDIGSLAKWFFFNRRIGRLLLFGPKYSLKFLSKLPQATIELSTEQPEWCTVTLDQKNISLEISNDFKETKAELTVFINNQTATALEQKDIKIKAEFKGLGGIKASSNETTISFRPAYQSKITYNFEKEINITSTNETNIPITITNNGNGDAIVKVEIENTSENWNISIYPEETTIPIGNTKQVDLITTPTKTFKNQTIKIKITTKSAYSGTDVDEKYLTGETIQFSITLINTQPKEEEKLPLFEILVIGIVVIILISIVAMILVRKKKQQ